MLDPITLIWVANAINAIGIPLSFCATYSVGASHDMKRVFTFACGNAVALTVGSLMLGSYPLVVLNVLWLLLSIAGYYQVVYPSWVHCMRHILPVLAVLGILSLVSREYTWAAYVCMSMYVVSFVLFSARTLKRLGYLSWCVLAYFFTVPHLIEYSSFAILAQETFLVLVSLHAIFQLRRSGSKTLIVIAK